MTCGGCGNEKAYSIKIRFGQKGEKAELCDRCGGFNTAAGVPDVYFQRPYFDENISHPDHPESVGGSFITSKSHKAYLLKKFGLQEAGDRRHGTNNFDPIAARHARDSQNK